MPTPNRSDIVGIVRFSMVSKSPIGFPSLLERSLQERESEIFSANRMERRFAFLQHILLPTLMRQNDQDFRLVVVTTENLPLPYRDRLNSSLSILPQASVLSIPVEATLLHACRRSLQSALKLSAERWSTFRIDDDDGLSLNYVARLRQSMQRAKNTCAVTMVPGLEVIEGDAYRYRLARKPCSGAGLALVSLSGDPSTGKFKSVYQLGAHRKVGERVHLELIRGAPAYLRLIHGNNVSRITAPPGGYIDANEAENHLQASFGYPSRESFELIMADKKK